MTRRGVLHVPQDALYRTLRWIERHVRGFYAAVGLFLVLGFALVLGGLLLFIALADLVNAGATQPLDERVLLELNARAEPWLDAAALEITALGATAVLTITILVASAFLWLTRHHWSVALLWTSVIGGVFLNVVLKSSFDRPRPRLFEWRIGHAAQSSFPSGHAMTAMVVYGTLAYLVMRLEPTPAVRRLTFAVVALVILLVGMSRVYLGVHYPSDVIAGYAAGFAWATFCALGIEAIRYFRSRKPDVARTEQDLDKGLRPIREAMTG